MIGQEINEFINRGHAAALLFAIAVLLFIIAFKDEIKKSLKSK